jgi:hypothetical protein
VPRRKLKDKLNENVKDIYGIEKYMSIANRWQTSSLTGLSAPAKRRAFTIWKKN